jgi:hypothetical protein
VSATEILEGLSKLSPIELNMVHERILELEESHVIEPSAEFDAAIEEGLQSLKTEPQVSLDEARKRIAVWSGRSA